MNRRSYNLRRKEGDSSDNVEGWQIVYCSFILIVLCFFIMLSSFSTIEEQKISAFVKSFINAVSILPGGLKFESGSEILDESADIVDKNNELAALLEDLKAFTSSLGLEDDVTFVLSEKGLVMRLSDTVLYDLGAAKISPEAVPLLKKVASIISKTPFAVRIEGHTDDLPINTRRFPSNWELSTARAVNALRYLIEKEKIPPQRVSAVGFGEFQPISANDSPEHRAENRRVEVVFFREKE